MIHEARTLSELQEYIESCGYDVIVTDTMVTQHENGPDVELSVRAVMLRKQDDSESKQDPFEFARQAFEDV